MNALNRVSASETDSLFRILAMFLKANRHHTDRCRQTATDTFAGFYRMSVLSLLVSVSPTEHAESVFVGLGPSEKWRTVLCRCWSESVGAVWIDLKMEEGCFYNTWNVMFIHSLNKPTLINMTV